MITLEYIKKGNINNNAVSCSLFKMKHSYRDFGFYTKKLNIFIENKNNGFMKDWTIYLFIDESVIKDKYFEELKKFANKDNNLSIIKYDCTKFKLDNIYHDGTFGSIVRYMPFFKNSFFKDHEYLICTDIDNPNNYFSENDIIKLEKKKYDILFVSYLYYNKKWALEKNPITGNFIFKNFRLCQELIDNFLINLSDGKYDKIIKTFKSSKSVDVIKFQYGTDEYFLNYFIYKHIIKNKFNYLIKIPVTLDSMYKSIFYKHSGNIKNIAKQLVDYYEKQYNIMFNEKNINTPKNIIDLENKLFDIIKSNKDYEQYMKYINKYKKFRSKTNRWIIYLIK
jgi:hypothetical protein